MGNMKSYSSTYDLRVLEYLTIFGTEVLNAIFSSVLREFETSNDKDTNKCLLYTSIRTNKWRKFILKLFRHISVLMHHLKGVSKLC